MAIMNYGIIAYSLEQGSENRITGIESVEAVRSDGIKVEHVPLLPDDKVESPKEPEDRTEHESISVVGMVVDGDVMQWYEGEPLTALAVCYNSATGEWWTREEGPVTYTG